MIKLDQISYKNVYLLFKINIRYLIIFCGIKESRKHYYSCDTIYTLPVLFFVILIVYNICPHEYLKPNSFINLFISYILIYPEMKISVFRLPYKSLEMLAYSIPTNYAYGVSVSLQPTSAGQYHFQNLCLFYKVGVWYFNMDHQP